MCLILHVFQFSCNTPGHTVGITQFSPFSVFLAIIHVLPCLFLIFYDFNLSCHTPVPRVCISHFPLFFSFLFIIQVLQCVCFIFHIFQCFSPYFTSYSVFFSFSMIFTSYCHTPGPRLCISHFPHFGVFLAILQIKLCLCLILHFFQCFLPYSRFYNVHFIFHVFECFSPYSRSNCVCFSFYSFFSVSRHIPGPSLFVSYFPCFLVFSP